jgi:hypothetical protein
MITNPIIVQLAQFAPVAVSILKPVVLVCILLTIFLVRPNLGGTIAEQMKGIAYVVLMGTGIFLATVGALPPFIAVISAQNMQPEWYITFLFTFISGGLLYVWSDNKLRDLPLDSVAYTYQLFRNCVRIVGHTAVALSLVSLATASLYNQLSLPGMWAVPVTVLTYGLLLSSLTKDTVKKTDAKPSSSTKRILIATETTSKKRA